ncbi:MAG: VOC family protein [Byssovorax sp.]
MIPRFQRVDHIHIYVVDRAAAEAWYADVLGFARIPELEFWAGSGPLTVTDASGTVHLALFQREAQKCRSVVALAADAAELLAWQKHLTSALGQPIELVDHQVSWSLYFTDPDGNPYEITTYEHAEVAAALSSRG